MKKTLPLLLGMLLCAAVCHSEENLEAEIRAVESFHPRPEASEGERAHFDYVVSRLSAAGIPFRTFDFRDAQSFHSFSSCLEVTAPGERPDTLVICAPLDHAAGTAPAESGTPNTLLALRWLEGAWGRQGAITLKFLFLGAEFGEEDRYPMGSRLYLEDFYPAAPVAVLYLNLPRESRTVLLRAAADRRVAPPWLVRSCLESLGDAGLGFRIRGEDHQLYRIGVKRERAIVEPYLAAGYPALSLEGGTPPDEEAGSAADWYGRMDRFFRGVTESFREGIPESWDRHFLLFQHRRFVLIIPEGIYLALLGGILGLSVLVFQIYNRRFLVYLKWVLKDSWFLALVLAMCFAFLFLSTLAIGDILRLRNDSELWKARPFLFLALKFALFGFLWIITILLRRRLPYRRRRKLFSYAALLFLFLDTVILSLFNIAFSYYFLWAYFFVFLYSLVRNRLVKVLLLAAAPFWLLRFAFAMFALREWEICRTILLSRVWGNLLLAVFAVPFILLLMKMSLLFPGAHAAERFLRWAGGVLLGGGCVAAIVYLALFSPYGADNPQVVEAVNTVEPASNRLELSSHAPLGRIAYRYGSERGEIETEERSAVVEPAAAPDLLDVGIDRSPVLAREDIELLLRFRGDPYGVDLAVSSEESFVLLGANFPFTREAAPETERVSYSILIGKNPPNPLRVSLILPKDIAYTLSVGVALREAPFPLELSGEAKTFRTELVYREELGL